MQKDNIRLSGKVNIKIGKREVDVKNDVSPEFASALIVGYLYGFSSPPTLPTTQYQGLVQSSYLQPTGIAVVFLNNGTVVNQIQMTTSSFSDNVTTTHVTQVQFSGSDATPTSYTFNQLELYTVNNGSLSLLVAQVTLQQPLTKDTSDIVTVTWSESITTGSPFVNASGILTQSCTSTNNLSSTLSKYSAVACQGSFLNAVWAVLLIPSVQSNVSNSPIGCFLTPPSGNNNPPAGIYVILALDNCGNVLGQYQPYNGYVSGQVTQGVNNVYGSYNFLVNTSSPPNNVAVLSLMPMSSHPVYLSAGYPISGVTITGLNQIGIALKVPYGPTTLQNLGVSNGTNQS
ncbi:hypothetical protein SSRV2_ORF40 [Saccharolobus shibatae rod virus 2]|nr:hypothetical protein SSRV2_ORF40 [Saccharolobus shibatae rod virus 2]